LESDWKKVKDLPSGGQGYCALVKRISDNTIYFSKCLKKQQDF
jgi:hypothetical protein